MQLSKLILGGAAVFICFSLATDTEAHRSLKAPPPGHLRGEIPTAYARRHHKVSPAAIKRTYLGPVHKIALERGWIPAGTSEAESGINIVSAAFTYRHMPYTWRRTRQDHMLVELKGGDVHVVRLQAHALPASPLGPSAQWRLSLAGFGSAGVVTQAKAEGIARGFLGLGSDAEIQRKGLKDSSYLFQHGSTGVLIDVWTGAPSK